jgi:hypothetical protein
MATEADVKVDSVWRWVKPPPHLPAGWGTLWVDQTFRIDTPDSPGKVKYHYVSTNGHGCAHSATIAAHALLVTPAPEETAPPAPEPDPFVVGSRWRWAIAAGITRMPFTIANRSPESSNAYVRYDGSRELCVHSLANLRKYAEPLATTVQAEVVEAPQRCAPACAPDCTPAKPCMRVFRVDGPLIEPGRACPGHREVAVAGSPWARRQSTEGYLHVEEQRPAPELRCDRELACGLYRGTR